MKKYKKLQILFAETASSITINLEQQTIENWQFDHAIHTNYKARDTCMLKFELADGAIQEYEGYVPSFFPGQHFGDYIMLHITKEGKVMNFTPTDEVINRLLEKYQSY